MLLIRLSADAPVAFVPSRDQFIEILFSSFLHSRITPCSNAGRGNADMAQVLILAKNNAQQLFQKGSTLHVADANGQHFRLNIDATNDPAERNIHKHMNERNPGMLKRDVWKFLN